MVQTFERPSVRSQEMKATVLREFWDQLSHGQTPYIQPSSPLIRMLHDSGVSTLAQFKFMVV